MTIRRAGLWGLALLGLIVAFVFAKVEGGFLAWFIFSFVFIICLYELFTALTGLRYVSSERKLSATRVSAGQSLQIHIDIRRRGWWPIFWLRIRDDLPGRWAFAVQGGERVLLPLWAREFQFSYQINNVQRGVYRIGNTSLQSGDLLGLMTQQRVYDRSDSVIVYPRVVPVRGWSNVHPEELGMRESTRRRSEESTNVLGVRAYVPGDRLSRIHWPATARSGTLLAKEFEMHVSSEILFVPDVSAESYRGLESGIFELAMTTVASLMKYVYERHRKFGLTLHGDTLQRFPAGSDEALFMHCLEALAMAGPAGKTPFSQSLLRIAQEAAAGTIVVAVSPRLDKQMVITVEQLRRRTPVEWFAPMVQHELTSVQRSSIQLLESMRVPVYPLRQSEQLSQLVRGGGHHAAKVR